MHPLLALAAGSLLAVGLLAGAPGTTGAAGASGPNNDGASGAAQEQLREYVDAFASEHDVPGLAAAVADLDDGVTFEHATGRDGDGDPVTRSTPFLVGSVAKTMTATVVLGLAEDGALTLDDRVADHVPGAPGGDATIRELLTHTGGFTAADGLAVSDRGEDAPADLDAALARLERTGEEGRFEYSSAGYLVLGAVVESVTGQAYPDALRERLLEPAGMADTTADPREADLPPGHRLWWGRPVAYDPPLDPSAGPYGSVVTTLADLERYAAAQLGAGDTIPEEIRAEAQRAHVETPSGGYGFGWRITEDDGEDLAHHTGANPGWFAHVLLVPEQGSAVIVLANSFGEAHAPSLGSLATDLHRISTGRDPQPAGYDPLLRSIAPGLGVAALLGVGLLALAAIRPPRRPRRYAAAAGLVAVVLALTPMLAGYDLHTLRVWLPDAAATLLVAIAAWALAALTLLVRSRPGSQRRVRGARGRLTQGHEPGQARRR